MSSPQNPLERIASALEELCAILRPKAKARGVSKQQQLIDEPVVERIPVLGGEFAVTESFVLELEKAYPGVMVTLTLSQIRTWALSQRLAKQNGGASALWTLGGAPKGINGWFAREQNKSERASH